MAESQPFPAPSSSWWVRAYYTPASDALRGKLTGRLDVRAAIAAANLPVPVARLIGCVVDDTRLWRTEKLDVARELVAHFSDGLAAGRTAEQLIADFGPPQQAAKLIRLAKVRGRSRVWHIYRFGNRTLLLALTVGVVGYAALSARFFLGNPNTAENHWTQINNLRRSPENERAWPIYRTALFKLGRNDYEWLSTRFPLESLSSKECKQYIELLERHAAVLALVREGATKPHFGYLLGDANDIAEARAAGAEWLIPYIASVETDNRELITATLEGVYATQSLARILDSDALLAAQRGDPNRVEADVLAILAISEQMVRDPGMLVEQLVAMELFQRTLDRVDQILRDQPQVLSDVQLRNLAHRIAAYRGGTIKPNFDLEKRLFDDLLQRSFTDDGHGDGRITREGLKLLSDYSSPRLQWNGEIFDPRASLALTLAMPGGASFVGTRRENRELYVEILNRMAALHQGPPWTWDVEAIRASDHDNLERTRGIQSLRYGAVAALIPSYVMYDSAEQVTQHRDATEVALALELWRRCHGTWPASLDQLVPDLLPAVPPDRADGQPLRYVLRDGKPVVYSLGADRDDDGGRSATGTERGRIYPFGPVDIEQLKRLRNDTETDGDWILWPPLADTAEPVSPDESGELDF